MNFSDVLPSGRIVHLEHSDWFCDPSSLPARMLQGHCLADKPDSPGWYEIVEVERPFETGAPTGNRYLVHVNAPDFVRFVFRSHFVRFGLQVDGRLPYRTRPSFYRQIPFDMTEDEIAQIPEPDLDWDPDDFETAHLEDYRQELVGRSEEEISRELRAQLHRLREHRGHISMVPRRWGDGAPLPAELFRRMFDCMWRTADLEAGVLDVYEELERWARERPERLGKTRYVKRGDVDLPYDQQDLWAFFGPDLEITPPLSFGR